MQINEQQITHRSGTGKLSSSGRRMLHQRDAVQKQHQTDFVDNRQKLRGNVLSSLFGEKLIQGVDILGQAAEGLFIHFALLRA